MKSHLKECRENWNNNESIKTTTPRQLSSIGLMSLKIRAGIDKAYYPELDQVMTRISSLTLSKLILYYYLLMFFLFRSPNYWM
jgi:hypothetical protein